MRRYPSADGLLCGISFLSYLEPRSSADCARLRATRSPGCKRTVGPVESEPERGTAFTIDPPKRPPQSA
jgi:hypothetical protein